MKKTTLLPLTLPFFLLACAQHSGILTPKEKSKWSNKADGSIILQESHVSTGPHALDGPRYLQFSASFGLRDADPLRYDQCSFAGFEASRQNKHVHSISKLPVTLMGQKHLLVVKDSMEQVVIIDSIYIPRPIYSDVGRTIKPGARISWTVDSAGPAKYVQIELRYSALQRYDLDINNQEVIMERVLNDAKGSYILTKSDLKGVPDSAQLNVHMSRNIYHGIKTLPESGFEDCHLFRTISSTIEFAVVQRQ